MKLDADILPAGANQNRAFEIDDADADTGKGIIIIHHLLKCWSIDEIGQLNGFEIR